jgi:phosphatidylglycerol:prolipoprotein diacylglycerol transferase
MLPTVFGLPTYFVAWGVAALVGVALASEAVAGQGMPRRRAFPGIVGLALLLIVGAKLQSALQALTFGPLRPVAWTVGFQVPGGVLLLVLGLPMVARGLGLPPERFADGVMSVIGAPLAVARAGCFLRGCCFGIRSEFPWALRFPRGSPAYFWHMEHGWIGGPVAASLPVEPLQLYYVLFGVALYVLGRLWLRRRRTEGEVSRRVALAYFGGTLGLELLRQERIHVNLVLGAAALAVGVLAAARRPAPAHRLPLTPRSPAQ